jgi:hypothetical protein
MTNTVANPIENQANEAGKLFAVSELDAAKSLEMFARTLGETPDYATWVANRTDWVNGYTEAKPQAKGNSADQAFARFARRLTDTFGINAPKAQTEAAVKKAAEREAKAEKLAGKYADFTTNELTDKLRQAYELQAKNPTRKLATLKELETVVKARTKEAEAESRDELKAARTRLFELAKACTDLDRIEAAADVLDEVNYEISIN